MKGCIWVQLALVLCAVPAGASNVTVGSKAFTEGFLLAELAAQQIASANEVSVGRRFGLGGSAIAYEALKRGEIDVCPDYSGSIADLLLRSPQHTTLPAIEAALRPMGFAISRPVGFENTYALAVTKDFAERHRLTRIRDLEGIGAHARVALSHEFCGRPDGLAALQRAYSIAALSTVEPIDHVLAYKAIGANKVDVIDVYTTDSRIEELNLVLLQDDAQALPHQQAVYLVRSDFSARYPASWGALQQLEGRIDAAAMRAMNGQVEGRHASAASVIKRFLGNKNTQVEANLPVGELLVRTHEHLVLVGAALAIAVFIGIPLGVVAARSVRMGRAVLLLASLLQTIPALALLSLLVPLCGVGLLPAMVALCSYSLLPVVSSTSSGLQGISADLLDTARILGLGRVSILFRIQLPLASRSILTGLRTAIVTSIGTATLAALVGAGGYGASIMAGLALNDRTMVLFGAVPAAAMALLAHLLFEAITFALVPRGLVRRAEA